MSKPLCVIVDDEELAIAALRSHLDELDLLEVERIYTDPDKFLAQLDQLHADILFLDMEMSIYGDEVARDIGDRMKVIFVTGRPDKAVDSYEVGAVDFVTKPIRQSRLKKAIEKALGERKVETVTLKTSEASKHAIPIKDIVYVTTDAEEPRDKLVYLKSRVLDHPIQVKNKSFSELMDMIPGPQLLRVNKDTLVNVEYVTKLIQSDLIAIQVGVVSKELTLGDSYKEGFLKARPEFE